MARSIPVTAIILVGIVGAGLLLSSEPPQHRPAARKTQSDRAVYNLAVEYANRGDIVAAMNILADIYRNTPHSEVSWQKSAVMLGAIADLLGQPQAADTYYLSYVRESAAVRGIKSQCGGFWLKLQRKSAHRTGRPADMLALRTIDNHRQQLLRGEYE